MYNDTPSRDEVRNESVVFSLMLYTNNKVSQMNRQFLGIESAQNHEDMFGTIAMCAGDSGKTKSYRLYQKKIFRT